MTVRELREMLYSVCEQEMTVRELRAILFAVNEQDEEITEKDIARIEEKSDIRLSSRKRISRIEELEAQLKEAKLEIEEEKGKAASDWCALWANYQASYKEQSDKIREVESELKKCIEENMELKRKLTVLKDAFSIIREDVVI